MLKGMEPGLELEVMGHQPSSASSLLSFLLKVNRCEPRRSSWRLSMHLLPLLPLRVFFTIVIGLPNDAVPSSKPSNFENASPETSFADIDRKFCISMVHPAETFPLILAIGIFFQALAFAGIQGTGLKTLTLKHCGVEGQLMLPGMFASCRKNVYILNRTALFVVPYIQLVFGLECAIRSLRRSPFHARGKYDVTICCATVVLLLIGTWIPSNINPQFDNCFASLVWYISRFALETTVLLAAAGGLMILSVLIIFIRLSRVNTLDEHQRIAASRMVYYLVMGIVSLVRKLVQKDLFYLC